MTSGSERNPHLETLAQGGRLLDLLEVNQRRRLRMAQHTDINFKRDIGMRRNLGRIDQIIRTLFGFALLAYIPAERPPDWQIPAIVGLYLLLSGSFSYCPFYAAIGVTTAKNPDHLA